MEELRDNFNIKMINETITEINKELKKMKDYGETNSFNLEMNICEMFPEFYNEYTFLVKKICKGDNIDTIYKMLNNLKKVEDGSKTLKDVEHSLGNELFNKYMKK